MKWKEKSTLSSDESSLDTESRTNRESEMETWRVGAPAELKR